MWVEEQIETYRRRKAALPWLDAHCWIGVGAQGTLCPVTTFDETRQLLERYGIRRAIVAHAVARDYDLTIGNRLLMETLAGQECFWGAAVLAPGGDAPHKFREHVELLIVGRIRLVRIFPRSHNWLLSPWCAGPWLDVLEELRMPVAVWHTEASWDEVAAVCQAHPRLPVIVEGPNRKLIYHSRVYYRLLEQFANFHLEIHNLVSYLGVDDIVRRFGSRQLIFGTFFPRQDPNVPMMLVTHGELRPADQENIAHANMERLMEEVGT
jgi:predicted TIM-barrel fold metal-dependent hydrolase